MGNTIFNEELTQLVSNNSDLLDQYVLVISECYQYAKGICGQEFSSMVVFKNLDWNSMKATGYSRKGDWRKLLSKDFIKNNTKKKVKGTPSPYGEVGARYRIVKSMKFKDLIKKSSFGDTYLFNNLNTYFHYSTPEAIDGSNFSG